ncbi:hypothetical protein B0H17DRAFT_1121802 [Mycena rosella]|uniref:T6SS Phospholipase effector Tle1-like catalytic domain-containing protein n=1 Tax=Mycena rosella TaxID=1033263 RepID=A0AAD7AY16_MYCRO|nr:hypothetical protein B0H17DRAFT_1121802 [Mycena rosella]
MQTSPDVDGHARFQTDNTVVDHNGISGLPLTSSPKNSLFPQQTYNGSAAASPTIPPDHPFRTLYSFDSDNSNIVQLFSMLSKADRNKQLVYYQYVEPSALSAPRSETCRAGIGTYTNPQIATPLMSKISKVRISPPSGYEFLMQNYTANDRICIFGFSRGAYTARSLAGMIHKVGLLPPCNHQQIPFAYKMYTDETEKGWKQSNAFKKAFSIHVDIEFIGRRAKFKPNLWNRPNEKEKTLSISDQKALKAQHPHPSKKLSQRAMERQYSRDSTQPTDIDEVWFAGCHYVGGGVCRQRGAAQPARIPLRWMIRECFKTNSGILFDCDGLRSIGLDPGSLYPYVAPRPPPLAAGDLRLKSIPSRHSPRRSKSGAGQLCDGRGGPAVHKTEEEMELQDALCPQRYQQGDNKWVTYLGWNMGRGRFIPKQKTNGIRVHRSVKARLEAQTESGGQYKPKAAFDLERTTWVD